MRLLMSLLLLGSLSTAHADPNAPLLFQLRPVQYHAYRNDPPPPLTLTLHLQNPVAKPLTLKCLSVGAPVLKRWTEFQDGQAVNSGEMLGQFQPVGDAPTCSRVGEVLTLPPGANYTYTSALGPQKVGAQVNYSAGWNVSLRPGFSWLSRASASALVVDADRPVATPTPEKYQDALDASGATWQTRSSRDSAPGSRLSFRLADELSRQAFLSELKKRGLDAGKIAIEVAQPVPFSPTAQRLPMTVTRTAKGYTFTLKLTNRGQQPLQFTRDVCPAMAIERASDGLRVWQQGNGPCPAMAPAAQTLRPGESVTGSFQWDGHISTRQPAAPGKYRALFVFGSGAGNVVGEATFTVE